MIVDDRVYTVDEAAKVLRISPRSYYAGLSRGELPGVRIGRVIRVSGSQLARLLEVGEGVVETTQPRSNAPAK